LSDFVLGFEDFAAALAKTLIIEAEHAREKSLVGAREKCG